MRSLSFLFILFSLVSAKSGIAAENATALAKCDRALVITSKVSKVSPEILDKLKTLSTEYNVFFGSPGIDKILQDKSLFYLSLRNPDSLHPHVENVLNQLVEDFKKAMPWIWTPQETISPWTLVHQNRALQKFLEDYNFVNIQEAQVAANALKDLTSSPAARAETIEFLKVSLPDYVDLLKKKIDLQEPKDKISFFGIRYTRGTGNALRKNWDGFIGSSVITGVLTVATFAIWADNPHVFAAWGYYVPLSPFVYQNMKGFYNSLVYLKERIKLGSGKFKPYLPESSDAPVIEGEFLLKPKVVESANIDQKLLTDFKPELNIDSVSNLEDFGAILEHGVHLFSSVYGEELQRLQDSKTKEKLVQALKNSDGNNLPNLLENYHKEIIQSLTVIEQLQKTNLTLAKLLDEHLKLLEDKIVTLKSQKENSSIIDALQLKETELKGFKEVLDLQESVLHGQLTNLARIRLSLSETRRGLSLALSSPNTINESEILSKLREALK